ncbi:MAG: hypothetical protein ACYDC4_12615 [Candidatus Dormibacteria bacterium]
MSEIRSPRRRRSVAVAPALLDPAELPEDAPGRVKLISVAAPADIVDAPAAVAPLTARSPALLAAGGGWVPVTVAGAVIVVLFIVGMLLTRS